MTLSSAGHEPGGATWSPWSPRPLEGPGRGGVLCPGAWLHGLPMVPQGPSGRCREEGGWLGAGTACFRSAVSGEGGSSLDPVPAPDPAPDPAPPARVRLAAGRAVGCLLGTGWRGGALRGWRQMGSRCIWSWIPSAAGKAQPRLLPAGAAVDAGEGSRQHPHAAARPPAGQPSRRAQAHLVLGVTPRTQHNVPGLFTLNQQM